MICLIALFFFAVLGLISAKYRAYFFEAGDCVFRKVTLRKCTTSFDKKMKMKICSKLIALNKPIGSFIFKNFDVISWVITILMIVSLLWTAYVGVIGVYNWVAYGNCNGPASNEFCVFNSITGEVQPANTSIATYIVDNNLQCDLNLSSNNFVPKGE